MKIRPLTILVLTGVCSLLAADEADRKTAPAETATIYTVESARQQAKVLHDVMHRTLHVTHDQFYREDEGLPIPAFSLKQVFAGVKEKQGITLQWLVVEGLAMNTDHKATTEFERSAVRSLRKGEPAVEQVADGVYRRVAPIRLTNHCLKCHLPDRRSTRDRKAGLMISMSVTQP